MAAPPGCESRIRLPPEILLAFADSIWFPRLSEFELLVKEFSREVARAAAAVEKSSEAPDDEQPLI